MAAFSFRVEAGAVDLRKFLKELPAAYRQDAVVPALNKTASYVRTRIVRKISKEAGAKQKHFRDKIKIIKARRASNKLVGQDYAAISAYGAVSVNLIGYVDPGKRRVGYFNQVVSGSGARNRRYRSEGVRARVGGKSSVYRGTFIGTNRSGRLKVYRRIGVASPGRRQRISEVPGPSARAFFGTPGAHVFMRREASARFPVELRRAGEMVKRRLERKYGRR